MSITTLTFITANKLTTSANAIMLQYTAPVFVIILSAIFLKRKVIRGQILAIYSVWDERREKERICST